GRGAYRGVFFQRHRVELRAQDQNLIPVWHWQFGAHGSRLAFAAHRHLMDFLHVPAGGVIADEFLRVVQLQRLGAHRFSAAVLPVEGELLGGLVADRAFAECGEGSPFGFLVIDIPAYAASVLGHVVRLLCWDLNGVTEDIPAWIIPYKARPALPKIAQKIWMIRQKAGPRLCKARCFVVYIWYKPKRSL